MDGENLHYQQKREVSSPLQLIALFSVHKSQEQFLQTAKQPRDFSSGT